MAPEQFRRNQGVYESILRASPDGITVTDSDGYVTMVSPAVVKIFGYGNANELVGRHILEFLAPEDVDTAKSILYGRQEHNPPGALEYRCVKADGSLFFIESSIDYIRDQQGRILGNVIIGRDITERKQVEERLRSSEMRWNFALQGAGDGVWDWNMKTGEIFFSRQWKAMIGYEDSEIENKLDEWLERVHPDDFPLCQEKFDAYMQGETDIYRNEHRMLCKDGSYLWILNRARAVEWCEDGKPCRIIGTHKDISSQKAFEETLFKAKEAAEISSEAAKRFLSVIAHEFNTPLGLLTMSVDILDRYWNCLDEESREAQREQIRSASGQMSRLVDSVLSFNKHPDVVSSRPAVMDVAQLCRRVMEESVLLWKNGQIVRCRVWPESMLCKIDESLIRRIVSNLLSNAFKYTPTVGKIAFYALCRPDRLKIVIRDNGIGIMPDDMGFVCNAFYRGSNISNRGGIGLGLSIVKEALEVLHGTLAIKSSPGKGTTFRVVIPLDDFMGGEGR